MRAYEKLLMLPILCCLVALAILLPYVLRDGGDEEARAEASRVAAEATEGATGASTQEEQGPLSDPETLLLCAPEEDLRRLMDPKTHVALAADEAGHFALYGGADAATGMVTDDSYELLVGCLPQLAFTNYATVLAWYHDPERAGPANASGESVRSGDSLLTRFALAGGVRLEQRLSLSGGVLRACYRLKNGSTTRRSVSLRALITPPADTGPEEGPTPPRFFVASQDGTVAVEREREIRGEDVKAVSVPRRGAASDSSGRLVFGPTRPPDLLTFAPTMDLSTSAFRYAPGPARPLPPASSVAAYWLYEDLAPGEEADLSYRYEPLFAERAPRGEEPQSEEPQSEQPGPRAGSQGEKG